MAMVDDRYYHVVGSRNFELRRHFQTTSGLAIWILYEERTQFAAEMVFANASTIKSEGNRTAIMAYTDGSGAQTPAEVAAILLGV